MLNFDNINDVKKEFYTEFDCFSQVFYLYSEDKYAFFFNAKAFYQRSSYLQNAWHLLDKDIFIGSLLFQGRQHFSISKELIDDQVFLFKFRNYKWIDSNRQVSTLIEFKDFDSLIARYILQNISEDTVEEFSKIVFQGSYRIKDFVQAKNAITYNLRDSYQQNIAKSNYKVDLFIRQIIPSNIDLYQKIAEQEVRYAQPIEEYKEKFVTSSRDKASLIFFDIDNITISDTIRYQNDYQLIQATNQNCNKTKTIEREHEIKRDEQISNLRQEYAEYLAGGQFVSRRLSFLKGSDGIIIPNSIFTNEGRNPILTEDVRGYKLIK